MDVLRQIAAYEPRGEQEEVDRRAMLRALVKDPACFDRTATSHFTASAWVVDPSRELTLLVYHNIYRSWSWIGGHADGDHDLCAVALRELAQETGVGGGAVLERPRGIFSLEALPVAGHMRKGRYVGSHVHLNVTYLVVADPAAALRVCPDENAGVRWVPLDQVESVSSEPWMCEWVYQKLVERSR